MKSLAELEAIRQKTLEKVAMRKEGSDEIRVVVIATGFDNVPNSAKMSMDGNKDKDSGSTGLFTEAATAAADKKPARASASKPSSDVGSDDAAFDVLMRIFDKDNR